MPYSKLQFRQARRLLEFFQNPEEMPWQTRNAMNDLLYQNQAVEQLGKKVQLAYGRGWLGAVRELRSELGYKLETLE